MTDLVDDELASGNGDLHAGASDRSLATGVPDELSASESRIISARGTEEGLVLRIDGRAEWKAILSDVKTFLGERRRFLEGGEVAIEWLDRLPTGEQSAELERLLRDQCGVAIAGRKKKAPKLAVRTKKTVDTLKGEGRLLRSNNGHDSSEAGFDELEHFESVVSDQGLTGVYERMPRVTEETLRGHNKDLSSPPVKVDVSAAHGGVTGSVFDGEHVMQMSEILGDESLFEEEANARIIYGVLRSGQRVETPFSLVVVGDVNPGADLVAGGDIVIFGSLRGTAHASAYDDDCMNRVIIASRMQPMQLRIGSVISRGNGDKARGTEIARIEDRRIVVEAFQSRAFTK